MQCNFFFFAPLVPCYWQCVLFTRSEKLTDFANTFYINNNNNNISAWSQPYIMLLPYTYIPFAGSLRLWLILINSPSCPPPPPTTIGRTDRQTDTLHTPRRYRTNIVTARFRRWVVVVTVATRSWRALDFRQLPDHTLAFSLFLTHTHSFSPRPFVPLAAAAADVIRTPIGIMLISRDASGYAVPGDS